MFSPQRGSGLCTKNVRVPLSGEVKVGAAHEVMATGATEFALFVD